MRLFLLRLFAVFVTVSLGYGGYQVLNSEKDLTYGEASPNPQVLGVADTIANMIFRVNIPAKFEDAVTFSQPISAPNLIESLQAGDGIEVDNNKITNTGILSLVAGTGITVDGNKITNSGITSLVAGPNISIDGNKITNTYSAPSIDYTLSGWTDNGTSITLTTTTDSVTVGGLTTGAIVADSLTTSGLALAGGLTVTSGNSLMPETDLGSDIGDSTHRFNNLWVANINSNSSQSFSGQTTFSYAPTDTTITQASVLINPTTSVSNGQLLGFGVGGYQRALIDADGDLVLGYNSLTSAPATAYPLDIYGHSGTRVAYIDTSGNLTLGTTLTSTGALTVTPLSGSNLNVSLATTGDFAVNTNQLYVDTSAARVGIGTASPASRLEVSGDSITELRISSSGTQRKLTFYADSTSKGSIVSDNNVGTLSIIATGGTTGIVFNDNTGNTYVPTHRFGIGTTTPTTKLHVSGAVTGKALAIFDETGDQALFTASASGVSKVTIDHNGQIGVGTVSPSYKLHIEGTGYFNGAVRTTDQYIVNGRGVMMAGSSTGDLRVHGVNNLELGGNSSLHMIINASGNVGIGTTSPTSKFHVSGATVGKALSIFNETGDQALLTASASGVTKFIIDHSGNVGIGTSSPTDSLDIVGSTNINSTAYGLKVLTDAYNSTGRNVRFADTGETYYLDIGGFEGAVMRYNSNLTQRFATSGTDQIYIGSTTVDGGLTYGTLTVVPYSASTVGLLVQGKASQTADLLNIQNSAYTKLMVVDKSGNVGIGTSTPTTKLHVSSATVGKALSIFNETGDQAVFTASVSGVSKVTINNSGYLGIGTVSPTNALEVVGAMRVGGNSTVNRYVTVGSTGTLTSRIDNNGLNNVLVLENRDVNGDEGAGILFNLAQSGSNNAVNAGKIYVIKEQAWTSTASTRDSAIVFNTSKNGTQTETLKLSSSGLLNGTAGGLASYVKAGTISDTDFTDTPVDGLFGFDTTNHRLYFREGAAWSYIAKTGGFQIPDFEAEGLSKGDYLIPYVESNMSDGAVHGLYAKWSEVKTTLLSELWVKINEIETKLLALKEEIFTKKSHQEELCVGTMENETCITKDELDKLIELIPSPTASSSASPLPSQTPTPTPSPTPSPTPTLSPSPESSQSGVQ